MNGISISTPLSPCDCQQCWTIFVLYIYLCTSRPILIVLSIFHPPYLKSMLESILINISSFKFKLFDLFNWRTTSAADLHRIANASCSHLISTLTSSAQRWVIALTAVINARTWLANTCIQIVSSIAEKTISWCSTEDAAIKSSAKWA